MERNELFEKYLYLADELAAKYGKRYAIDEDDAVQEARICLLNMIGWKRSPEYTFEEFFHRFAHHEYLRRIFELYCPVSFSVEMAQRVRKGMNMINYEWGNQAKKSYQTKKGISEAELNDIIAAADMVQNFIDYEMLSDEMDIAAKESVEDEYIADVEAHEILRVLQYYCTEREVDIISRKLGLLGHRPESFNDLADEYGVSKQRVGQLYKKGLEKLNSYGARHQLILLTRR